MRTLAIVLALSSFSAFAACPDLTGTYSVCRSTTGATAGMTDVTVTQKVENGVTVYSMTSTDNESHETDTTEMIADGQTRTSTQTDPNFGEIASSETYTCSDVKVIANVAVAWQGQEIANVEEQIQKKDNTVEIDMNGTVFGTNVTDTLICD